MNNSTIFTHFYFIKYVFVLVFKKIPLYRGFPLNLLTLNRGPTVFSKLLNCENSDSKRNQCIRITIIYSFLARKFQFIILFIFAENWLFGQGGKKTVSSNFKSDFNKRKAKICNSIINFYGFFQFFTLFAKVSLFWTVSVARDGVLPFMQSSLYTLLQLLQ